MNAVVRLRDEIEATQLAIRRHKEAGEHYLSDLAAARCYGLLLAAEILGVEPAWNEQKEPGA